MGREKTVPTPILMVESINQSNLVADKQGLEMPNHTLLLLLKKEVVFVFIVEVGKLVFQIIIAIGAHT